MNIVDELATLGINGRQAKVYIALLQLGPTTAIEVAKTTKLHHPTVYDVLENLKERRLVSENNSSGKRIFVAEDPEHLRENEESRQRALDSLLPSLKELYQGSGAKPKIRFYEGVEGILTVHEQLLAVKSKEYFYFGSVQEMFKTSGEKFLKEYYTRRIKLGIRSYAIRVRNKESAVDYMQPGEHNLRQVRYLPRPISEDIAGLYLYDDKIAVMSALRENYTMIIESRELFVLLKTIWQCVWDCAAEE